MSDWQESWDKMEETVRRERDIGETEKDRCKGCGGRGHFWHIGTHASNCYCHQECPRCKGSGVWP